MSINKIATDTNMMQNDIRELEELIKIIERASLNIKQDIDELNTMWNGRTKATFSKQLEDDYIRLQQVCVCISGSMESIKLAEKEYAKCEEHINEVIKNVNI